MLDKHISMPVVLGRGLHLRLFRRQTETRKRRELPPPSNDSTSMDVVQVRRTPRSKRHIMHFSTVNMIDWEQNDSRQKKNQVKFKHVSAVDFFDDFIFREALSRLYQCLWESSPSPQRLDSISPGNHLKRCAKHRYFQFCWSRFYSRKFSARRGSAVKNVHTELNPSP